MHTFLFLPATRPLLRSYSVAGLMLISLLLSGCEIPPPIQKLAGETQGTTYHVSYWSTQTEPSVDTVKKAIDAELQRIDQVLSNYRSDSDIEHFNSTFSTEPQAVNAEIIHLIKEAQAANKASDGCYDLTIKPLFDLWGFKAEKLAIPEPAKLAEVLAEVGIKHLEIINDQQLRKLKPTLRVDLSSIAQGYSVWRITQILEHYNISNYLAEIGGELQVRGTKPEKESWRIALEKPVSNERSLSKVMTINRSTSTSIMTAGTYRHYFDAEGKRYSHILNAKTGKPIEHHTVSVTVIDEDPTRADAWDTALLCMGRTAGIEAANRAGIAALFIEQQEAIFTDYTSTSFDKLIDSKQIIIK
ncbi:MAG: FAD:protein FMN transferase [Methylovulum sp.]